MPVFNVHLPTRFITVIKVEADSKLDAINKVKDMQGDHIRTRFVDYLFEELGVDCVSQIGENDGTRN